ncbi:MAG: Sua5/YciO/YrdC/YwlC family protein [Pseudomonadales bacterium]|nr:Sua5/YciO/YrdC/YwlC family protein [Pseudomonadales bacterium]
MASFRQLIQAQLAMQQGGIIAYPTEAVYGYGCDPYNPDAVERLLKIKQRPWQKGLILIAASVEQIEPLLGRLNEQQLGLLLSSWGVASNTPTTWLLPDPGNQVPRWIRGTFDSVAVRVSHHPIVKQLCERWGGPLVSTSANISGQPPVSNEWVLRRRLQAQGLRQQPDVIVSGKTSGFAKPSEIRDLLTEKVIRPQ